MLELLLSYSLQDFLLFSPETWWILYLEFIRVWWFSGVALSFLLLVTMVKQKQLLVLGMPALLLLSIVFYYRAFYVEINSFANYLVALCAVQFLLYFVWCWRNQIWRTISKTQSAASNSNISSGYVVTAFLVSIAALIIVPVCAPIQSDSTVLTLFLPGQQALVSALFLVFITRRYLRIRLLYLVPISAVVVIEILTFHVMALPFWWVGIIAAISALWRHRKN